MVNRTYATNEGIILPEVVEAIRGFYGNNAAIYLDATTGLPKLKDKNDMIWYIQLNCQHFVSMEIIPEKAALGPINLLGNWGVKSINTTQEVIFTFGVPACFSQLIDAYVIIIPDATETIQYDLLASVSALGESKDIDNRSLLDQTKSVTVDIVDSVDVSGILSGLSPRDAVSLRFQSDTNDIHVFKMIMNYRL